MKNVRDIVPVFMVRRFKGRYTLMSNSNTLHLLGEILLYMIWSATAYYIMWLCIFLKQEATNASEDGGD